MRDSEGAGAVAGAVHFEFPVGYPWFRPAGGGDGFLLFQAGQGLAGLAQLPLQPADDRPVPGDLLRKIFVVGSPGGVSPPGSHRTVREPLGSHGSCHPGHQALGVTAQWAKSLGCWVVMRCQHA